jgi:hypothetical protein
MLVGQGPEFYYVVAAVAAVIVLIGAFIGSRITGTIAPPSLLSLVAAVSFAVIAAAAAIAWLGAENRTDLAVNVFTFAPVAAAIAGYFFASKRSAT